MPTIAARPGHAYQPEEDATVAHLLEAAIAVGKANLNQFGYRLGRNAIETRARRRDTTVMPGSSGANEAWKAVPPACTEADGRFAAETGPTHSVVNNAGIQFRT